MYSKIELLEKFLRHVLDIGEDYSNFDVNEQLDALAQIMAMAQLLDNVFIDVDIRDV